MLPTLILSVFCICMISAMLSDIFTMKISNYNVLVLIISFFVFAPITGMGWSTIGSHVSIALLVLAAGFGLFAIGGFGAGDVKMATGIALWLGFAGTGQFLLTMAIFGGLLALALVAIRRVPLPETVLSVEWIGRLYNRKTGIPYGLAMGPAALFVLPETPWMAYFVSGAPIG